MKLQMQLVPMQFHGVNLRAILKPESWKSLSRAIRNRDKVCVHCGGKAEHCHEVWEYVVSNGEVTQRLVALEGVCKDCHDFIHYGRVQLNDSYDRQDFVLFKASCVLGSDCEWMATYINGCFVANMMLSQLPAAELMDLKWIHLVPPGALGMEPDDWTDIWYEIDQYMEG